MRFIFALFALILCGGFVFADNMEDIEKNINSNKAKLLEKTKEQQKISTHLTTLGNTINARKAQITKLQAQIDFLQKNISQNQSQSQSQAKQLDSLQKTLKNLESQKNQIQLYIANLIINDIAFTLILDKQSVISPDDIILEDVFELLTRHTQQKIVALNEQQSQVNATISKITNNINEISVLIDSQQNKKEQLQKIIKEQDLLSQKLQSEINDYNQKLVQISKERVGIDSILQELNIVKANKQKQIAELEAKKQRERELAQKNQNTQESTTQKAESKSSTMNIVQVANSYKNVSVVKYTGAKTIAPLDYYSVEQNFGPYYDPVYNLKVFNESVTLISKMPNSVVYSIFDGKVVYAKEAPILKKVVIIEHSNEMYSIYSQLDKIAPTIKPGFVVKKGYTIGRVSQRLGLEITQKDKHIDPLEIIAKSK